LKSAAFFAPVGACVTPGQRGTEGP